MKMEFELCLNCVVAKIERFSNVSELCCSKNQAISNRPISGRDKGGMLANSRNRRKTPHGDTVHKG